MEHLLGRVGAIATAISVALMLCVTTGMQSAIAGTTGSITGTVRNGTSGAPLAGVRVTAASPSQAATTTTDSHGFYAFLGLGADTYTVSFSLTGYTPVSVPGVTVFQDQNYVLNEKLTAALKTIATVQTSGASNLVKPNQGSDVYNVTGQQLTAATNPADLHQTLYEWTQVVPGVTSTGFPGQPRVRGGQVTDLGYELDGIPINDRIVGFFTTNLSNIGVNNLEVYTGGLSAQDAANGTGYLNSVVKTGTYPGYSQLSAGMTAQAFNHYLTFETGGATANHRWSYYVGFDGVNSQNDYDFGKFTFPNVLFWGYDGPGPVYTRDVVGNFHYRPNTKDDFQVLYQNSYGVFDFNYLINKTAGQPPALQFEPCPGAVPSTTTFTGATGGTAPNGQTCPTGLYWGALPNGQGNVWYHYGGIGKIQWNHNLSDRSFFSLRFAENYNMYNFDQPLGEANIPSLENGAYNWGALLGETCPAYPYAAGSPVVSPTTSSGTDNGNLCAFDDGIQDFLGTRRSNMYFGALDYTNAFSDNFTLKAGINNELDHNEFTYLLTNAYNTFTNTFPALDEGATYPTNEQQAWLEPDVRLGKFLLAPGVLYARMHYGFPGGGAQVHAVDPTFNGTYTFDPRNVMRFSWGDTSSFISSAYVWTDPTGYIVRHPFAPGNSFNPQITHSADLQWEHDFADGTSFRIGPWYKKATNYYAEYKPIIGYTTTGVPIFSKVSVLNNNQRHQDFGVEAALNHVDNRPRGISFWITGTYDNYWTTTANLPAAFISFPEPENLINEGILLRSQQNPLWSTSALFDLHSNGFHVAPLIVYQADYFFNVGVIGHTPAGVPGIAQPEQISAGYWKVNLNMYKEFGGKNDFLVGFKVNNLLNNTNDVTPCPNDGTGCFPFDGPQSGVFTPNLGPGTNWIYQDYTQDPRLIEFYAGVRM
jgi:hypothetical protein